MLVVIYSFFLYRYTSVCRLNNRNVTLFPFHCCTVARTQLHVLLSVTVKSVLSTKSVLCSERQRIITFSWPYRSRLVNGTKQQKPVTLLAVCNYTFEHSLSVSMHIACYSDKGSALHETKNYVAKTTQPLFSVYSCWFYQTIRFLVIPPSTNYTLTGHFIRYTYSTAW